MERRLKEALRYDRARMQIGNISHFGLMEMSRQRLRQGVVEVSTMPCPVCQGVGHIRSTESVALMILRSIEDHLRTQGAADLTASASTEASLYILNHKRAYLRDIELRYGVSIVIQMDENAVGGTFVLTRGAAANAPAVVELKAIQMEPSQAAGEDEEEAGGDSEEKRAQRRKRKRLARRGESLRRSWIPEWRRFAGFSMPLPAMKAARRKRRMRPAPMKTPHRPSFPKGPRPGMAAKAIKNSAVTAAGADAEAGVTAMRWRAAPNSRNPRAGPYRASASSQFWVSIFIFQRMRCWNP